MKKLTNSVLLYFAFSVLFILSCNNTPNNNSERQELNDSTNSFKTTEVKKIILGAEQIDEYLPLLADKNIALVVNQTSMLSNTHLVDTLLSLGVAVKKIFAPEHGFRGNLDRGKNFNNKIDEETSLPIISLLGKNKRPTNEQLADIDIVIFDIQDVGVRFYTYISTMHEVMESCAENQKQFIVLDRPNPNGDYIDGPVLQKKYKSFVGMHPIPIVHGLTVGELAQMINGELWLENGICELSVISVKNYTHSTPYSLPVKPSPNLPNDISIRLYPSLCFFEATNISIGRGTEFPFQVIGYPNSIFGEFTFTPQDIDGMQTNPIQEGEKCFGIDLRNESLQTKFTLKYVIEFYTKINSINKEFFARSHWFNLLAGNSELQQQIEQGFTEQEIKDSWQEELNKYKEIREQYLIYK